VEPAARGRGAASAPSADRCSCAAARGAAARRSVRSALAGGVLLARACAHPGGLYSSGPQPPSPAIRASTFAPAATTASSSA